MPYVWERGSSQHRTYQLVGFGALAVVMVLLGLFLPEFQVNRLSRVLWVAVSVLGLNLVVGFSGLLALCQSAFIAIGAFVSASLIMDHGWDYWMTIPFAMLASFIMGVIIGVPALKIKGLYLAMATVAFAAAFPSLTKLEFLQIAERTGGANGREITEKLEPTWFPFWENASDRYQYFPLLILTALAFWLVSNLVRSRAGRAVIAIRDNEIGAAVSGVNLRYFKVLNFGMSAAIGGLAGVMLAMNSAFVAEQDFTFVLMVDLLVALVVGGVATVSGGFIGAIVVVFGRWLCQTYFDYSLTSMILLGVSFIAAMLFSRRQTDFVPKAMNFLAVLVPALVVSFILRKIDIPGWIYLTLVLLGITALMARNQPEPNQKIATLGIGAVLTAIIMFWMESRTDVSGALYQLNGDGPLSQAIFGIVLIVVVFFAPQGIVGAWRQVWSRVVRIVPVPPALPEGAESIAAASAAIQAQISEDAASS